MPPPKSYFANATLKQARVLVIDDNDDQWLLMKLAMQACLPEVTPVRVATPEEALALLDKWHYQEWELPKFIILDLYLPQARDGWELLQSMKALPAPLNQIPILMFSASANPADVTKGYTLGISVYLVKPAEGQAWMSYFQNLRAYWWETVSLPPIWLTR